MKRWKGVAFLCLFALNGSAQHAELSPEVLLGGRSFSYLHTFDIRFGEKFGFSNLTLYDNDHQEQGREIYFIRGTFSYRFVPHLSLTASLGLKNPGDFYTLAVKYDRRGKNQSMAYTVGLTYQKDFSLEQSLSYRKELLQFGDHTLFFRLLAIVNIDSKGYQRGLQQLRIGVNKRSMSYGAGANFDQFDNSAVMLVNYGLFFKYELNY